MGNIDRKILYLVALIVMALPLFVPLPLPVAHNPNSLNFFNKIQNLDQSKGKNIILLSANFSPDTRGESLPQCRAIIRHMLASHKKFAIFTFNATSAPGQEMANSEAQSIANELNAKYPTAPPLTYGKDWVNLGFKPATLAILQSLPRDIPRWFGQDSRGTPVADVPMMKNIKDYHDLGVVIDVSPSATYLWLMPAITDKYQKPLLIAPTSVMVPDTYPFVKSGQIQGLLRGVLGAAEYESLTKEHGLADQTYAGTRQMTSVAALDGYIIILIIIGNVAYFRSRKNGGAQ
ncbi:MAG TPA: hypothetical protein VGM37_02950 [Armatimonadota bacterium]|jgi:hypothetical protein